MQFKVLASTTALVAAMMFAGPASAQSINGVTIPESELAAVQARCDELKAAADTESESTNESPGDANLEQPGDNEASEDTTEASGAVQATTPTIDLETIDLQACVDAGLVME